MKKVFDYILEVSKEMKKVSWPNQTELINNTVVTILAMVSISLFIFGSDQVITWVLEFIYR